MPRKAPLTVSRGSSVTRARPKSVRQSRPSFASSRLAGLTSRWTIPRAWAWCSASATSASRRATVSNQRLPVASVVDRLAAASALDSVGGGRQGLDADRRQEGPRRVGGARPRHLLEDPRQRRPSISSIA